VGKKRPDFCLTRLAILGKPDDRTVVVFAPGGPIQGAETTRPPGLLQPDNWIRRENKATYNGRIPTHQGTRYFRQTANATIGNLLSLENWQEDQNCLIILGPRRGCSGARIKNSRQPGESPVGRGQARQEQRSGT